jgi:DNA polymerase
MMRAREGHDFLGADFSAIEARVLNWIAGQQDIVRMFAAGEDVYVHNAMRIYGLQKHEVKKFPHRHTGKFAELGMGYQMGAKTAVQQGKDQYQIELTLDEAKAIVKAYRDGHPQVVQFWRDANNAAKRAVAEPGTVHVFGPLRNLKFVKRGNYLYLILPSKRALIYSDPQLQKVKTPWILEEEIESGMASDPDEWPEAVTVWGVDSQTKKWGKYALYGGLLAENIAQALSRDIMLDPMFRLEEKGYATVLSVHDEIVTEVPSGFGSVEEMETIMRTTPDWAKGCPINAEGWRGQRYRK